MAEESDVNRKNRLISSKFLGCKVLDNQSCTPLTSYIELGGFLHDMGNKGWMMWRKSKPVTLGFVDNTFTIAFKRRDEKVQVFDLQDVSKVSVHPTRDRVVGFLLNDRCSQKLRFVCFKLCRKSNMTGLEFKKLHRKRVQLFYPKPKVMPSKITKPRQSQKQTISNVQDQPLKTTKLANKASLPTKVNASSDQSPLEKKEMAGHKYGRPVHRKLVRVVYRTPEGMVTVTPSRRKSRKPIHSPLELKDSPTYNNLSQDQEH